MSNDVVEVERRIDAPPTLVWQLITDVTRMGEWSPETTAAVWTGGATGPEVGATFRGRNQIGIRRWSTSCRVTAAEPGKRFTFEVTSGPFAVAEWSYEIQADGDGCVVRERWKDNRSWILDQIGWLASGVKDRAAHNRAGMEQTLERLAAAAEAQAATST